MTQSTNLRKEPSFFIQYITLPYHLLVSAWFDVVLDRPSANWYTRSFSNRFEWFLTKRNFRLVANPYWINLLQLYLNAKWMTMKSPAMIIRVTYLVDSYEIVLKPTGPKQKWRVLADVLNEFTSLEQMRKMHGIDLNAFNLEQMMQFLDSNWSRLEAGAAMYSSNTSK